MPEQTVVDVLFFQQRAVGVTLPNFIEQKVIETEPGFRGDTATGVTKPAKIPTGATVNVPAVHQRRRHHQDRHPHRPVPGADRARLTRAPQARQVPRVPTRLRRPAACPAGPVAHPAGGPRLLRGQGFLEVETPARVRAPGQEVHLEAFPAGGDRFLITSPEYHMKRLVAAGSGPHLPDRPGLPGRGERAPPPARVHHRRVVPRRTQPLASRGRRLRGAAAGRGRGRRVVDRAVARGSTPRSNARPCAS